MLEVNIFIYAYIILYLSRGSNFLEVIIHFYTYCNIYIRYIDLCKYVDMFWIHINFPLAFASRCFMLNILPSLSELKKTSFLREQSHIPPNRKFGKSSSTQPERNMLVPRRVPKHKFLPRNLKIISLQKVPLIFFTASFCRFHVATCGV